METLNTTGKQSRELTRDEAMMVVGGNDIANYVKCVNATLSKGAGGLRTALLGATVFGMARLFGVMVGCSSL